MSDYTALGLEKLAHQAAADLTTIRCPRDSVVMRLLVCRAERTAGGEVTQGEFHRPPRGREWRVREVDVECPACRRRALHVHLPPLSGNGAGRDRHDTGRPSVASSLPAPGPPAP